MKDTRDRREYHKALRASPGYMDKCRAARALKMADAAYAEKERERERLRSVKRRAIDAHRINQTAKRRHAERMASDEAYRRTKADNAIRWVRANPAKALANVVRRDAKKLLATPKWADKLAIDAIYAAAAKIRATGKPMEVDHIVPLRSPLVCGLHVPANLQLLDTLANKSKGNRQWPDQ